MELRDAQARHERVVVRLGDVRHGEDREVTEGVTYRLRGPLRNTGSRRNRDARRRAEPFVIEAAIHNDREAARSRTDVTYFHRGVVGELLLDAEIGLAGIGSARAAGIPRVQGER